MHPLLNGILFGLLLTILLGPILFALLQTGIERGFRAGAMVGLGVWISDMLYILLAYFGVSYLMQAASWPGFELLLGIGGGLILIGSGLATVLSKPPTLGVAPKGFSGTYFALWLKGFLINTVNPFTVFFWISVMTTVVAKDDFQRSDAIYFFGGILGTIIITDLLKVLLAKMIRQYLRPVHLMWTRRIAGIALILFGIGLIIRVAV